MNFKQGIIQLLFIGIICLLGSNCIAQIEYGEIIDEEVIEEPINSEAQRRTALKVLQRDISIKLTDAWSSGDYDYLSEFMSAEIQAESDELKKLMNNINNSYPDLKLGTQNRNEIFSSTYWDKAEGFRLNIRHFYREHLDTYQVFMIVVSISERDKEEVRYDFPSINGEIHKITQDLDYDRYSDVEEQNAWSIEGIEKSKIAIRDSTIARFGIKTIISNLFEAKVKLNASTATISDFEFLDLEILYKDMKEQFILISHAEKNEFEEIQKYVEGLDEYQKSNFKMNYIKEFYRDPKDYNTYDATYDKIATLLNKN